MSSEMPAVNISPRSARRIAAGHLWIYANEADMSTVPEERGAWCRFVCRDQVVGTGYANRHSLILGRVVSRETVDDIEALLRDRLTSAIARRRSILDRGSARLVFSESDLLAGLIVDWYPGVAVVQSNTAGIDRVLPALEGLIPAAIEAAVGRRVDAMVIRGDAGVRRLEGVEEMTRVVRGDAALLASGSLVEDGLTVAADFVAGQKTGFFIDQRDNRAAMESAVAALRPRRVLDLCCYSGAWGLRALRAGAAQVVFVDENPAALRLAQRSVEMNGFGAARVSLIRSDVFDFLDRDDGTHDLIAVDPPAFVKSRKNLPQALKAYEKLNRLSWRRLRVGGALYTCSCSHLVSREDFTRILRNAVGREGGRGQIVYHGAQGADHPVLLAMPETEYLKCVGVRKLA